MGSINKQWNIWELLFCWGPTRPPAKSRWTPSSIWEIHMFWRADFDLAGGGCGASKWRCQNHVFPIGGCTMVFPKVCFCYIRANGGKKRAKKSKNSKFKVKKDIKNIKNGLKWSILGHWGLRMGLYRSKNYDRIVFWRLRASKHPFLRVLRLFWRFFFSRFFHIFDPMP